MRFIKVRPIVGFLGQGLLLLLLALMIGACFGSSDSAEEAVAPTATPAPPTPAPPTATTAVSAPTATTAASAADATTATTATTDTTAAPAQASEPQLFKIDPAQSEARFIVDEVLFGNPNTVTGRTNGLTGEINIDLADPTKTTVGPIQIDARSLATDNRFRNRSISRFILQSNQDQYQYITFTPTSITGLPASAKAGDSLTFQISGDLKIRDATKPVTFDVTVKADSPTQISGLAKAVIQRADFGLEIPKVEGVADVTEQVQLELQFIAAAQSGG